MSVGPATRLELILALPLVSILLSILVGSVIIIASSLLSPAN